MVAQVGSMKSEPILDFASTQENPSPGSALTNAAAAARSGLSSPPKLLLLMSGPNRDTGEPPIDGPGGYDHSVVLVFDELRIGRHGRCAHPAVWGPKHDGRMTPEIRFPDSEDALVAASKAFRAAIARFPPLSN